MSLQEKRRHERAQYFLVHQDKDFLPVWVFKPLAESDAIAGLVIDIAEGGAQVLTDARDSMEGERYTMHLLSGHADAALHLHTSEVRRIWSRPEGKLYTLNGIAFDEGTLALSELLKLLRSSDHHLLRCTLAPKD